MRQLTASDRIALHMGQAILIENACQKVVSAVEGVTSYRIVESPVRLIEFCAGAQSVVVPFAGEMPPVVQRETVRGWIAEVQAALGVERV